MSGRNYNYFLTGDGLGVFERKDRNYIGLKNFLNGFKREKSCWDMDYGNR